MQKPESVQEKETHIIIWDFEIQIDPFIPARKPELVIIDKRRKKQTNKQNKRRACHLVDFAVPVNDKVKIKES